MWVESSARHLGRPLNSVLNNGNDDVSRKRPNDIRRKTEKRSRINLGPNLSGPSDGGKRISFKEGGERREEKFEERKKY